MSKDLKTNPAKLFSSKQIRSSVHKAQLSSQGLDKLMMDNQEGVVASKLREFVEANSVASKSDFSSPLLNSLLLPDLSEAKRAPNTSALPNSGEMITPLEQFLTNLHTLSELQARSFFVIRELKTVLKIKS